MEADWALIGVRLALYLVLSGVFGLAAFGLYGLRAGERADSIALRRWLSAGGVAGLVLSAIALVLLAATMAGTPPWPVDRAAIGMILAGSAMGVAWKARMVALVAVSAIAPIAAGRTIPLGVVATAAGIALGTLAWAGHGAMDDGRVGWIHLLADVLHLLAAGAWVGALLGLTLLVTRPAARADRAHLTRTHRALHGFGPVGVLLVGTIVATGLVNGWLLVGARGVATLPATLYGRLFLAKLALFGAMLALAALNRFRLTPAFARSLAAGDDRAALGALRRSLAIEATCAVAILALVAWLGTLAPPAAAM